MKRPPRPYKITTLVERSACCGKTRGAPKRPGGARTGPSSGRPSTARPASAPASGGGRRGAVKTFARRLLYGVRILSLQGKHFTAVASLTAIESIAWISEDAWTRAAPSLRAAVREIPHRGFFSTRPTVCQGSGEAARWQRRPRLRTPSSPSPPPTAAAWAARPRPRPRRRTENGGLCRALRTRRSCPARRLAAVGCEVVCLQVAMLYTDPY